MDKEIRQQVERAVGEQLSCYFPAKGKITTVSGKSFFIKSGKASRVYPCEANGLKELSKANAIRIAKVIFYGDTFLVTEFIESNLPGKVFFEEFGRRFASLHRYKGQVFGFYEDNFIGANYQLNIPEGNEKTDWTAFYFNKRLLYQFHLAEKNGYITDSFRRNFHKLEKRISFILEGSEEEPTLLHGDLWSGNYVCDLSGNPVLIDPAVYYGHREADLAMTKIFGGFSFSFYQAYQQEYPLDEGWQYRENIYKLYHILNHLNLFGRSYLGEAEYIVENYVLG